ncbi:cupin domain-containing protein [Anaerocolumna sp. MB42-C2]|uniref:cupin domain-containing protein n=1 Tax=Anaerocolumna sp. MB42-C2 TaxID=3070997 RepID=UPI0027E002B5|nr:cupin domain-containing protein [Anaerocolumna sp. MB42-C2]WMJ87958.1 cupin domain-containing protein [Anaerocolumna sp. MB42-C2]
MNENGKYSFYNNINSSRNNMYNEKCPSAFYLNSYYTQTYDNNVNYMKQFPNQYNSYFYGTKHNNYCNCFHKTTDYGPEPFVVNITEATKQNNTFRTALWTGNYLQLTLMSINLGEDIGLEIHPDLDQFIRIEEGQGIVQMGDRKDRLDFQVNVYDDFVFIIPAGTWHNLINTGCTPLKLYSIYAPPQHPKGTIHETKADAEEAENG